MIQTENLQDQALIDRWVQAGQEHVFRFWERLAEPERAELLDQLRGIPLEVVESLIERHLGDGTHELRPPPTAVDLEPAPYVPSPTTAGEKAKIALRKSLGEEAIAAGRVGVLLVAGGQATRLGLDAPKGALPITPIAKKSLFRVFAERIRGLERRYGTRLPIFVMTSEGNEAETVRFLRENAWFRLDPDQITFFPQGNLPAVDRQGKIVLVSPSRVFLSPDGHGGVVDALARSGSFDRMKKLGVEEIFYFQVDNPLVKIADPVFIGHHLHEKAQVSTKVVMKRDAAEKVGILTLSGGKMRVVEYGEIPKSIAGAKEPDGRLRYRAGNTAIHVFSRAFLERVAYGDFYLPHHAALKKVPVLDDEGQATEPAEPNGIKFERFVFDVLPFAERAIAVETRREDEFAPVKNLEGADSPATTRQAMIDLYGRWLEKAGIEVPRSAEGHVQGLLEIGPLYALDEEEFLEKVQRNLRFEGRLLLDED